VDPEGVVRVLVVPATGTDGTRLPFDTLLPADETLRRVADVLDERRVVGTRVVVEPPVYRGVTVVARVRARPGADVADVQDGALRALYRYYAAVGGGPDGEGWPFGRPVQYGEVFAVLQALPGVDLVEDVRLFPADPVTGVRGEPAQRIDLPANALVFSYDHQVRVTACED
jgi:predicted phage baseplate assembly protein